MDEPIFENGNFHRLLKPEGAPFVENFRLQDIQPVSKRQERPVTRTKGPLLILVNWGNRNDFSRHSAKAENSRPPLAASFLYVFTGQLFKEDRVSSRSFQFEK
ncbi:hypothetical protein HZB94_04060 [Candidatus Falkowbacteria bacterium]|nr:hypothetical protein [Candidatus Falkowbacteria bacterium]